MDIHKEINLFKYAEQAQRLLCAEGIAFYANGFPDLTKFEYIKKAPEDIELWPYNKRNQVANPRKTILTFFEADPYLYGYLNTLDKVASNLSIYYGVTGFDLSPCLDFSVPEQNAALLINALTNGLFLTRRIRVIPSLRIGNVATITALKSYPRNICYSFGSLGCNQKFQNIGRMIMNLKLALAEPSQILAYGKLSAPDANIFSNWSIPVVNRLDYQTITRKRTKERRLQNG